MIDTHLASGPRTTPNTSHSWKYRSHAISERLAFNLANVMRQTEAIRYEQLLVYSFLAPQ